MAITVRIIETAGLGDRSYLVHDGTTAFVVDPQRDIDRVLTVAADDDVTISAIFETHVHNDYVSGGLALSRRTGAPVIANRHDNLSFDVQGIDDGDVVEVGEMRVEARHSPGHTHTHLAYVLLTGEGSAHAVFTGGSLLYGTVGRTDLLGDESTHKLTREQWSTVRGLVEELPDSVAVYPTHGFGSFCSAQTGDERDSGTIADEHDNPAVTTDDPDTFISNLLAGLTDVPAYYAHMDPLNRAGLAEPDFSAASMVDVAELERRLNDGEWVIDLRDRRAYAGEHLLGTINFEADGLPTHLGWLLPWGTRLTLVADDPEAINHAQRSLSRIGIDRPNQADLMRAQSELETDNYQVVSYSELAETPSGERGFTVIDVRRADEYKSGHLDGAVNIALHQLLDHLHHVPDGPLWVHCASGARAAIGTSLLARAGFDATLVDGGPD